MRATGLPRFSHIEKNTRGPVDTVARHISCADQTEQPLILQRSIGEEVTQPLIEPAARHVEETAHECPPNSQRWALMNAHVTWTFRDLRRLLIGPPCSNDHPQGVCLKPGKSNVTLSIPVNSASNVSGRKSKRSCIWSAAIIWHSHPHLLRCCSIPWALVLNFSPQRHFLQGSSTSSISSSRSYSASSG